MEALLGKIHLFHRPADVVGVASNRPNEADEYAPKRAFVNSLVSDALVFFDSHYYIEEKGRKVAYTVCDSANDAIAVAEARGYKIGDIYGILTTQTPFCNPDDVIEPLNREEYDNQGDYLRDLSAQILELEMKRRSKRVIMYEKLKLIFYPEPLDEE